MMFFRKQQQSKKDENYQKKHAAKKLPMSTCYLGSQFIIPSIFVKLFSHTHICLNKKVIIDTYLNTAWHARFVFNLRKKTRPPPFLDNSKAFSRPWHKILTIWSMKNRKKIDNINIIKMHCRRSISLVT